MMLAPLPPDTAICLTTFERETLCRRLVASIRSRYPQAAVYVANDGSAPLQLDGATVYDLPFDQGVSAKRNHLARSVPAVHRHLVFVDDDMVFSDATDVAALRRVLDGDPALGLVSGVVLDYGITPRPYEATMCWEDGGATLRLAATAGEGRCDLTQNFFLARREIFDGGGWRDELKLAEHVPFFVDLKAAGWEVMHVRSVAIDHWPEVEGRYAAYRRRHAEFQLLWMRSRGLTKVIRPNGVEILASELQDPDYWPWVPASRGTA